MFQKFSSPSKIEHFGFLENYQKYSENAKRESNLEFVLHMSTNLQIHRTVYKKDDLETYYPL